jgi:hypothetical protein
MHCGADELAIHRTIAGKPFLHKIARAERERIDTDGSAALESIMSNRLPIENSGVDAADREFHRHFVIPQPPLNGSIYTEICHLGTVHYRRSGP